MQTNFRWLSCPLLLFAFVVISCRSIDPLSTVTSLPLPTSSKGEMAKIAPRFACCLLETSAMFYPTRSTVATNHELIAFDPQTVVPTTPITTPSPSLEKRIGDYTVRIWNGNNYPTHLPRWGYYGTATLTHKGSNARGPDVIIEHANGILPLPTSDINGDGYPDVAFRLQKGGSHCCLGTAVYTLDGVPTQLLEVFDHGASNVVGGMGEFKDLDQDGIYEFITRDDVGYLSFTGAVLTVLHYDPAQGYIPGSYLFPQAYQAELAQQRVNIATQLDDPYRVDFMTANYLYMGLPIAAWTNFTRLYGGNQDFFRLHDQIERRVFAAKYFAVKPPGVQTIADFATVQAEQLNQLYQINNAGGVNQVALKISPYAFKVNNLDNRFLALAYTIKGEAGQRYVGLERCFGKEQDWSRTPIIDIALRNSSERPISFFLQFGEGKRCGKEPFPGEVWRTSITLQPYKSYILVLPLNARQSFARTGWSLPQNDQIDLQKVGYFAFGVETDKPQQGVVQISPIRLWP